MKFLSFVLILMIQQFSFKETQLQHPRVKDAYHLKEITVKKYFSNKNLNYQGFHLFIRAFKKEKTLEVWVKENGGKEFKFLHAYEFCGISGELGPKRKEGDLQIPEGVYIINHFNPLSKFHLSLGLNYPNESDRILSDKRSPGSAIYIHGNCVTIGCIPISDDKIQELYVLCVEAKNNGQMQIPVHVFPAKLTKSALIDLTNAHRERQDVVEFWTNLKDVYQSFEEFHELKNVSVDKKGRYRI
jgi:murein L,D-transpeptidase YafK